MPLTKVLPLKTVRNPRDLGGLRGFDGRRIKFHRLLRTGKMSDISKADQRFLLNYGLKKVVDLRTPAESRRIPDTIIPGVQHDNISISARDTTNAGATLKQLMNGYSKDPLAGFKHMLASYRENVLSKHGQQAFHRLLELLADTPHGAVIFHCSEGKDRTGLATLFLLSVLGVDPETIRQDYLFSNRLLNGYRARRDKKAQRDGANFNTRCCMRSLGSVANEYLDAALLAIDANYGGLDSYLERQLGVTSSLQEQLRKLYLEK